MVKTGLTTIIMIVLVIAGLSLTRSFDVSADPIALSDAEMRELTGGCRIGHIAPGRYSKGYVTRGKGSLKACAGKNPCPSGAAYWVFARVACDPCSSSKNQLNKECGHRRLKTLCEMDDDDNCIRVRIYQGTVYSCDHGNGRRCP